MSHEEWLCRDQGGEILMHSCWFERLVSYSFEAQHAFCFLSHCCLKVFYVFLYPTVFFHLFVAFEHRFLRQNSQV